MKANLVKFAEKAIKKHPVYSYTYFFWLVHNEFKGHTYVEINDACKKVYRKEIKAFNRRFEAFKESQAS